MKQSKITEIVKVNEWKGPNGTIFYINMKLENGELISLGKKKADAFKIGDTVSYEDYTDDKGKLKQREVKEISSKPRVAYNPEANNRGAMIGMAIKMAFDKVYQGEDDFQKAAYLSQRIFELAMEMYNGIESDSNKLNETAENDELPF